MWVDRARKCKWRQLMLSLHFPYPLLKFMLCQQARTSYDAAYLLLLLLPAPVEVFHAAA